MPMYVVMTGVPRPELDVVIQRRHPKSWKWENGTWFISATETAQILTNNLAMESGVKNGLVVVRVTADYYGYSKTEFWDWIAARFKEEANG